MGVAAIVHDQYNAMLFRQLRSFHIYNIKSRIGGCFNVEEFGIGSDQCLPVSGCAISITVVYAPPVQVFSNNGMSRSEDISLTNDHRCLKVMKQP